MYEKLVMAVHRGDLNFIKKAHERGYKMITDVMTAAISTGKIEIIKYLIKIGVRLNPCDANYVLQSSTSGYYDITKLLLESGAQASTDEDLAICRVATWGSIPMVQLLMDYGANIHARDERALKVAARKGRVNLVKFLLKNGADPSVPDYRILNNCRPPVRKVILAHFTLEQKLELKMRGIL